MATRNEGYRRIDFEEVEAAMSEARRLRAEHIVGGAQRGIRLLRKWISGLRRRARTAVGAHA